jgi:catechol 2,3-dioxygenase-like lactoylglutathione lyase family enzyme
MRFLAKFVAISGLIAALPAGAQTSANPFGPGLRSVKIESQDFARSIAFYTALGMKAGANRGATQDVVWEGPSLNSGIVMTNHEYAVRAKMVRGGTYLMIVTPDIGAALARLRAAGFADLPQAKPMGTMGSYAILHDPDGNLVELLGPLPAK